MCLCSDPQEEIPASIEKRCWVDVGVDPLANLQQIEEKALDKEEARAREERKGGIGRLWK